MSFISTQDSDRDVALRYNSIHTALELAEINKDHAPARTIDEVLKDAQKIYDFVKNEK